VGSLSQFQKIQLTRSPRTGLDAQSGEKLAGSSYDLKSYPIVRHWYGRTPENIVIVANPTFGHRCNPVGYSIRDKASG
jgi:hypothetical protein